MGVTSAVFQISGNVPDVNEALIIVVKVGAIDDRQHFNVPDVNEALIIVVKVGAIDDRQHFKILAVILSLTGALPEGIELIPCQFCCIQLL